MRQDLRPEYGIENPNAKNADADTTSTSPRNDKYSLEDAEYFTPDTETLDDKLFPEAVTLMRQDLPPRPEELNPGVRERFRRTLDPDPEPRRTLTKICRTLMCEPLPETLFYNIIQLVA